MDFKKKNQERFSDWHEPSYSMLQQWKRWGKQEEQAEELLKRERTAEKALWFNIIKLINWEKKKK